MALDVRSPTQVAAFTAAAKQAGYADSDISSYIGRQTATANSTPSFIANNPLVQVTKNIPIVGGLSGCCSTDL